MSMSACRNAATASLSALTALLGIGIAVTGVSLRPAAAQTVQTYAAASAGSQFQEKGGPNSAVSDTGFAALNDGAGGLGQASAVVNLTDGSLSAASHGCSAPPVGTFVGYGNGHTSSYFSDVFDLTSATIPAGTLVDVEVHLAATLVKTFKFELKSFNDDVNGSASLRFSFLTNYTPQVTVDGAYSWQKGTTIQTPNGLLADGAEPTVFTLRGIPVGQNIILACFLDTNATGRSGAGQEMDSTIRVAANFGLSSSMSGVTLISRASGDKVPDIGTVNGGHLGATLPTFPLPTGTPTAPEPGSVALLLTGVLSLAGMSTRQGGGRNIL